MKSNMRFDRLQDFLDHLIQWRVPGNAVSVCMDGKEVFSYASGFADKENQIPMTLDHYVNIYSCSKVVTVTAALQLFERNLLRLDEPLYAFIPEYREVLVQEGDHLRKARTPITLHNLFTMTSGLTYNTWSQGIEKAREITGGRMDTLTVARCIAQDPLAFEPGTSWLYSLSHDVLAAVVEVISGKKFRDYVRENIFEPLDMSHTLYHNETVLDRMAQQYTYVNPESQDYVALQAGLVKQTTGYVKQVPKSVRYTFGPEYDSGGAGITSTAADYSKFCAALANGGVGAAGARILAPGTIDLLRTDQLTPQQHHAFNWEHLRGYGYGLGVRTLIDKAASGSNGSLGEFGWGGAAGCSVLVDPDLKLSVFYAQHMLNPDEAYYQPRLRNAVYSCI